MTNYITNWIGDDALLHKTYCEVRRHNPEGDILFFDGQVVAKREEGGKTYVDFVMQALTQDGELSAKATATAILPSRA
jgi:hypothetical protein